MRKSIESKSREEWENAVWQEFLEKVEKADSKKKLKVLLNSILSKSEKRLVVKRLAAISLIKQGKTYKEIGEILWLSPSTVSSIKKNLKSDLTYQSRRDLDKKKQRKQIQKRRGEDIDGRLLAIIDYWLDMPTISGKGRWRFLKKL